MQKQRAALSPENLHLIETVARTGSMAAAARELGLVPSALTYRVRQIEDALDVLIFDRSSRRARLTPAGAELLRAGEHLLRVYSECYGMRTVALRYFNIFGPRQADDSPYTGVIAIFARALLQAKAAPKIFGDGLQSRDFTYIDNVVSANLLAMERAPAGHSLFNVGAGRQVTLLELYRAMAEDLGVRMEPEFHPPRTGDVLHSLASLERIRAGLGYEPRVGWREGLRQTVAWYRERHRQGAPVNTNS